MKCSKRHLPEKYNVNTHDGKKKRSSTSKKKKY